MELVRKLLWKI